MWRELGLHDPFAGHDAFVTIGERIGQPDCAIPTCGLDWITTPQPVVLEHWPASGGDRAARFTSVASWRGPFGPIEYEGETYGLRVHEFRQFAELPAALVRRPFEVALDIDEAEVERPRAAARQRLGARRPRRGRRATRGPTATTSRRPRPS